LTSFLSTRHGSDDVRVSGVGDGESTDSEVLSTGGSKFVVVASVVVDSSLSQHGVVLDLRLAERWSVVGNDHQLALAVSQGLEGLLVSQDILAGLHDQGESGVDRLIALLGGFLLGSHGK